jgi:hypothetical protein
MNDYLQMLITIGSLGTMMYGMLHFMLRDVHKELAAIKKDIGDLKSDQIDARKRTDHLYQICIEMLGTRHKG